MTGTPAERFASFCSEPDENGCVLWTSKSIGGAGYPIFTVGGELVGAHRFAWSLVNGPIPDGMEIDHVYERGCRSKLCVNHAHLEPVTHLENMRRRAALITHCLRGHEYTSENTKRQASPTGWKRSCRECGRAADRAYHHRKKVAA